MSSCIRHAAIVDDDPVVGKALSYSLRKKGISCTVIRSFREASDYIESWRVAPEAGQAGETKARPDVIILDYHLDGEHNGAELCNRIRDALDIPMLMLTADPSVDATVQCLDSGADQHMHKPFHIDELLARMQASIRARRASRSATYPVSTAGLRLDPAGRLLSFADAQVELTEKETLLAEALIANLGKPVDKDKLYRQVCNREPMPESRSLDVLVGRLRRKLDRLDCRFRILSARSYGYKLISRSHGPA